MEHFQNSQIDENLDIFKRNSYKTFNPDAAAKLETARSAYEICYEKFLRLPKETEAYEKILNHKKTLEDYMNKLFDNKYFMHCKVSSDPIINNPYIRPGKPGEMKDICEVLNKVKCEESKESKENGKSGENVKPTSTKINPSKVYKTIIYKDGSSSRFMGSSTFRYRHR
jgi:hypothetical protein